MKERPAALRPRDRGPDRRRCGFKLDAAASSARTARTINADIGAGPATAATLAGRSRKAVVIAIDRAGSLAGQPLVPDPMPGGCSGREKNRACGRASTKTATADVIAPRPVRARNTGAGG